MKPLAISLDETAGFRTSESRLRTECG